MCEFKFMATNLGVASVRVPLIFKNLKRKAFIIFLKFKTKLKIFNDYESHQH